MAGLILAIFIMFVFCGLILYAVNVLDNIHSNNSSSIKNKQGLKDKVAKVNN